MARKPASWPVTIACEGTPENPHEQVSWLGTWLDYKEDTCEPVCWVCGARGYSTSPRYPYVRAEGGGGEYAPEPYFSVSPGQQ